MNPSPADPSHPFGRAGMAATASATRALGWGCRLAAAGILLQTLYFKFSGAEESVYIFARLGLARLVLYRAISHKGRLAPHPNSSFVSATFSREVAEAHFDGYPQGTAALYRQNVPVQRVFMTYLETAQMNRQMKEEEATLFYEKGNLAF